MAEQKLDGDVIDNAIDEVVIDMLDSLDADEHRETVIERIDEEVDSMWGHLVYAGPLSEWSTDDVAEFADEWSAILKWGRSNRCVETDSGLWEGLTHQVPVVQAFYTLRNLFIHRCADEWDIDVNETEPLKTAWSRRKVKVLTDSSLHLWFLGGVIYREDSTFDLNDISVDGIVDWMETNEISEELSEAIQTAVRHASSPRNTPREPQEGATGLG